MLPALTSGPLTIVGASGRAAVQSALRADLSPRAADLFADVDLRRACPCVRISDYPAGLEPFLARGKSGNWMYTGALENYPELVDRLAAVRPLLGNGADVLKAVRDPWLVAGALSESGLAYPEISAGSEGLPRDGTWLRKPFRSAGGVNVGLWQTLAKESQAPRYYFQRRLDGASCSAVYVAARRRALLLGVTRQLVGCDWAGAPPFRYAGSIGSLSLDSTQLDPFERIGQCLAERFDLVGLFGVDAMLSGNRVWTLEVNPRYTASVEVLERALGIHAVALHVAACREGSLSAPALTPPRVLCGKAVVYARCDTRISARLAELISAGPKGPWPRYGDIPEAGAPVRAGRPVLTVFASGDSEQAVLDELYGLATGVQKLL